MSLFALAKEPVAHVVATVVTDVVKCPIFFIEIAAVPAAVKVREEDKWKRGVRDDKAATGRRWTV